jgi:hypothetical protein
MSTEQEALSVLVAKDQIRELALLYARGVDRHDVALLRTLYTGDATDTHGDTFDGGAKEYVDFLERSFPYMPFSAHNICNHLVSVNGDEGEGEVYAVAIHIIPDRKGGWLEDFMCCRYIDRYRKENGRWLFAKRVVTYDQRMQRPFSGAPGVHAEQADASYATLSRRLFARGARA